jgi:hypothetical protein
VYRFGAGFLGCKQFANVCKHVANRRIRGDLRVKSHRTFLYSIISNIVVPPGIRSQTISFRVSLTEYKQFERIAAILNQKGKIRSDSAGSLAHALCFVKINEFIQLELMQQAADENEKKLQTPLGQLA